MSSEVGEESINLTVEDVSKVPRLFKLHPKRLLMAATTDLDGGITHSYRLAVYPIIA